MSVVRKICISLGLGIASLVSFADVPNAVESVFISSDKPQQTTLSFSDNVKCYVNQICTNKNTKLFYAQNPAKQLWTDVNGPNANSVELLNILSNSYYEGLDPNRYQVSQLLQMQDQLKQASATNSPDFANLLHSYELSLTDAYLNYTNDIQNGVVNPNKIYPTWRVEKSTAVNSYAQFIAAVNKDTLIQNIQNSATNHPQVYLDLRKQLKLAIDNYQSSSSNQVQFTSVLKLGMVNPTISQVKQKLSITNQYDYTDDNQHDKFNLQLQKSIKKIQSANGLKATGIIDKPTMDLINQTGLGRIKKIAINLDRMRWLSNSITSRRVWVNIPSYELQIYENNQIIQSMPVIVGSGGLENKTCSTVSKIKTIELNPFWGVPNRIATKEYLHKIQESSGYLDRHAMKLFKAGSNVAVDPSTVDWSKVTQKNFNYYIQQQPGVKNALGYYKFIFDNGCGIYLHDTANRGLFGRDNRSLSHGCVRVGNPKFLAQYLTNSNTNGYDFTKVQAAVAAKEHRYVSLSKPIELYVVYFTTYVDPKTGQLVYLNDLYGLDNIAFPLNIPTKSVSNG